MISEMCDRKTLCHFNTIPGVALKFLVDENFWTILMLIVNQTLWKRKVRWIYLLRNEQWNKTKLLEISGGSVDFRHSNDQFFLWNRCLFVQRIKRPFFNSQIHSFLFCFFFPLDDSFTLEMFSKQHPFSQSFEQHVVVRKWALVLIW